MRDFAEVSMNLQPKERASASPSEEVVSCNSREEARVSVQSERMKGMGHVDYGIMG